MKWLADQYTVRTPSKSALKSSVLLKHSPLLKTSLAPSKGAHLKILLPVEIPVSTPSVHSKFPYFSISRNLVLNLNVSVYKGKEN
jgi:hypothetical protein